VPRAAPSAAASSGIDPRQLQIKVFLPFSSIPTALERRLAPSLRLSALFAKAPLTTVYLMHAMSGRAICAKIPAWRSRRERRFATQCRSGSSSNGGG